MLWMVQTLLVESSAYHMAGKKVLQQFYLIMEGVWINPILFNRLVYNVEVVLLRTSQSSG